ncbi:MAG TPA: FtsX-like permease family protein [Gemmatimonadales bacterium]|nr:FtsX-like permease family protein [Gemmatimonadales bacterium]
MTSLAWALRSLRRHRARTALSLAGIAVAAAMLLDMVMLSGGLDRSFTDLLLARGYQIRLTPKGTLPFDAEATLGDAGRLLDRLRHTPGVAAAAPVLGTSLHGRRADGRDRATDSLVTLTGYGIDPAVQALYEVEQGRDLAPGDTAGLLLSDAAARRLGVGVGDTVVLVGRLDPQIATAAVERRMVVRALVHWIYDARAQASAGTVLPVMQHLAGPALADRVSLVMLKARDGVNPGTLAARLRGGLPEAEVSSVADLVRQFRQRMLYFRQLALILGTVSLIVTVLLVATLLTISVNERLGEIATLRAIGVGRRRVLAQVLAEGAVLTALGGALGILLGLATARYLDRILTSFPGLPAAFSFFVPRAGALATAGAVLLVTGALAGLYPAWLAASAPIAATLRAEAT